MEFKGFNFVVIISLNFRMKNNGKNVNALQTLTKINKVFYPKIYVYIFEYTNTTMRLKCHYSLDRMKKRARLFVLIFSLSFLYLIVIHLTTVLFRKII